jgi:hypothetical protein
LDSLMREICLGPTKSQDMWILGPFCNICWCLFLQIVAAPKAERKFVDLALPIAENDQVVARLQYLHHPGSKKSLNPICTICEICITLQFLGLNSCVVLFCCTSFTSFSSSIDGLWIILLQKKLHSCFCCLWIPAEDDVKPVTHWLALDIHKSAGIHLLQQALHHLVRALNKNCKTKHTLLFWHPIHFTQEDIQSNTSDIQKITSWWIQCWFSDWILKGLCQMGAENLRFYDFGISDFGICRLWNLQRGGGLLTSLSLILCFGLPCQSSGTKKGRIGILHNSKRSESEPSLLTQIVMVATQSPRYVMNLVVWTSGSCTVKPTKANASTV